MDGERQRTRALYDRVASAYATAVPDLGFEAPEDLAMIRAFVDALPEAGSRTVLDAGCGAGRLLVHLHRTDPALALTGVDLSPAMVAHARAAAPFARVEEGDLTDPPVPDGSMAGAVAWYSIIHLPPAELPAAVAGLRRVLRPGGMLLLAFQAGSGERRGATAYGLEVDFRAHRHDPGEVAALLARSGFQPVRALDRPPRPQERDRQAALLVRRGAGPLALDGAPVVCDEETWTT